MTGVLSPPMFFQFVRPNGVAAGYKLFTYIAGTTTKQATYLDSTLGAPQSNPMVLDANGVTTFWLDPIKIYKHVLAPPNDTDPPTSPIYTVDNIGAPPLSPILSTLIKYDLTNAEIAASVTPTVYSFPPGDVRRYGADPTGTNDSTAAFQAAISAMRGPYQGANPQSGAGGNVVFVPSGVFLISSTLTVYSSTQIQGVSLGFGSTAPGSVVNYVGTGKCFNVTGSYTSIKNLQILQARQNPNSNIAIFYTNFSNHNAVERCTISQGGAAVAITFTAAPNAGATSATLTANWSGPTAVYAVAFVQTAGSVPDGRLVTLTNGATTATWAYALRVNCNAGASASPQGWLWGIQQDNTQPGQELNLTEVYFSNNVGGLDWDGSSSITPTGLHCTNCYFEANGSNVRLGFSFTVTNVMLIGGENALFGVGYQGQAHETPTSVSINAANVKNLVVMGTSHECNGGGFSDSTAQLILLAQNLKGCVFNGNHLWGGSGVSAVNHISLSANCQGFKFDGNQVDQCSGPSILFATGAAFDIGINELGPTAAKIWDNTWTPVPTSLAVVNGTGGATYSGTWSRRANRVFFKIRIVVTGTCTTASTANTTFFPTDAKMPAVIENEVCHATSEVVDNYGTGLVSTSSGGRVYTPTWGAANKNIIISGSYLAADPV